MTRLLTAGCYNAAPWCTKQTPCTPATAPTPKDLPLPIR